MASIIELSFLYLHFCPLGLAVMSCQDLDQNSDSILAVLTFASVSFSVGTS